MLERMYLNGIIRLPEKEEMDINGVAVINLVKQMSEEVPLNQLYTAKEAYEDLVTNLNSEVSKDKRKYINRYRNFFNALDLSEYVQENVLFDKNATDLERKEQLKTISVTKDYIKEGMLLISRGIIVTPETFQVLESYKYEFENQRGNVSNILAWLGKILLTMTSFVVVYLFFYNFRREVLDSLVKTSFILFMMVLLIFIAFMVASYDKAFFYVVPFTILPIILRTFYDERVALFVHVVTVLLASFMAINSFDFIFLTIIAGMVAIFSLTNLYHRSRFFFSAFLVFLTYSVVYFGISVVKEGSFSQLEWSNFGYFGLNSVFTLLSFLLIYIFEKVFGFVSDTTLMELSDTNQPLLRKLAEMAPGTFQHSMQVANLSEEAIRHIGGNPLLVRTGALYHDIGKMVESSYFTENQGGGRSPHNDKDLKESAKIIINHVTLGQEMAKKHKLPDSIVDFIVSHHGTSTTKFFHKTYQNENPGMVVDKKDFQYPGPSPVSKETAVLMMADSVEAASRSLENYSAESISELVDRIVNTQLEDGQFENAEITFKDLKKVKEVFKTRLNNIYHARIAYPK
jgi:putative nucleotidyltransferase with HDIG domain